MPSQNLHERQDKQLVIGVTGRIGAGKTSVAKYLESAHGFYYIRYSLVLSEWLAKDSDDKQQLQSAGWEVMAGGLQAELNRRLIARIPVGADCAVDGLRHPIDVESLRLNFHSRFFLVYIDCPLEIRWQRLRSRYPQLEDFKRADSHAVEQQIANLRSVALSIIDNNGSLQDLQSRVDDLIETTTRQGG